MKRSMTGRALRAAAVPMLAAALAWGCTRTPADGGGDTPDARARNEDRLAIPTTAPSIRGTVTQLQQGDSVARSGGGGAPGGTVSCPPSCAPSGPALRSLLIEEKPGGLQSGGDKSQVTVLAGARVLRRSASGEVSEAGFAALRVGQRVEAWFTGPVAESYPTRATGSAIVIVEP